MDQEQEVNQGQQELNGPQGEQASVGASEQGVTLTAEQYNAVLDHIASLESKILSQPQGKSEVRDLDSLIQEAEGPGRKGAQQVNQNVSLEDMTPQQVMDHLFASIHQQFIQPLETKVETLRIMNEIDKVASKPGNEDFWDYAQDVKAIAIRNPTLSIQQAYRLAKTEGRRESGPSESGLQKKSDVLFTLPKRPANIAGGEKPGASGSTLRGNAAPSRRDAASEAFDKIVGGKK